MMRSSTSLPGPRAGLLRRLTIAALLAAGVLACRDERKIRALPPARARALPIRDDSFQPGPALPTAQITSPYEANAYAISEGQRLYHWFNCAGCHSEGGGGIGPAFMDSVWIYGSSPQNIHESIVEGRPNGMPSWGGHIPDDQIWELAAYVRSLGGLEPQVLVPPRTESLSKLTNPRRRPDANVSPDSNGHGH